MFNCKLFQTNIYNFWSFTSMASQNISKYISMQLIKIKPLFLYVKQNNIKAKI